MACIQSLCLQSALTSAVEEHLSCWASMACFNSEAKFYKGMTLPAEIRWGTCRAMTSCLNISSQAAAEKQPIFISICIPSLDWARGLPHTASKLFCLWNKDPYGALVKTVWHLKPMGKLLHTISMWRRIRNEMKANKISKSRWQSSSSRKRKVTALPVLSVLPLS